MPKHEDKHSMAEDYLAQVEWENNNNAGNRDGHAQWKNAPNWKYKKVYPKARGSNWSDTSWGIVVLLALLADAGYILYSELLNSRIDIPALIILFILLGLLFYVTRQPK